LPAQVAKTGNSSNTVERIVSPVNDDDAVAVLMMLQVKTEQRKAKPRRRAKVRVLRRASTQRRSQRSVGRSGYAFSHEEGFGELITSGSLMIRKHPARPGISNIVSPVATVDSVTITSPPAHESSQDDSGVPSVNDARTLDGSALSGSDLLTTDGVPLSPPIEETSFKDVDPQPVVV